MQSISRHRPEAFQQGFKPYIVSITCGALREQKNKWMVLGKRRMLCTKRWACATDAPNCSQEKPPRAGQLDSMHMRARNSRRTPLRAIACHNKRCAPQERKGEQHVAALSKQAGSSKCTVLCGLPFGGNSRNPRRKAQEFWGSQIFDSPSACVCVENSQAMSPLAHPSCAASDVYHMQPA